MSAQPTPAIWATAKGISSKPDGRAADDIAFDIWLKHAIHQSFGSSLPGPIPAELRRLALEPRRHAVK
jgi:hypothetical protein